MEIIGDDDKPMRLRRTARELPKKKDSLAHLVVTENMEAVHIFSQVGTLAETSRRTGLTIHQLTKMSREDWWKRELAGIQREQTAMENVRLSKLYGQTLDQIEERLEEGDQIYNRMTGETETVPVSVDGLVKIGKMLFEHRQLVREAPTQIISEKGSDKLEKLAEKLEALGQIRSDGEIIDIDGEGNIISAEEEGER